MNKARLDIAVGKLIGNDGRLEWLPKNPRQWTADDLAKTANSIAEDTDFLEDRPLLAVPFDHKYIVFAGNLRLAAIKDQKLKTAPVVVYFPETDEDRDTVKRRAMLDNGSFGAWDWDELANNWDDMPLADFGIPAFPTPDEMPTIDDEIPADLDAEENEKDFVLKITFPDSDKMTAFVVAYKDILENDYNCIMSESGGAL